MTNNDYKIRMIRWFLMTQTPQSLENGARIITYQGKLKYDTLRKIISPPFLNTPLAYFNVNSRNKLIRIIIILYLI